MLDFYPSSPGASSSRVTLDDLAEADRHTASSISVPPHAQPLPRRRRRPSSHTRRIATFALSLCLPYITSADALPSPGPLTLPPPSSLSPSPRWVRLSRSMLTRSTVLIAEEYKTANAEVAPWDWVILEQRFSPGFIVLSYLIAFVGSLCTLELLLRRTSNNGWRNQCLLAAAGICFGSVSTFSMHFIFNQALTLHSPAIQDNNALSLIYGPGYTVLSLVASCAAMTIAFFVMGTDLGNWCCIFGSARASRRAARENQHQADEYKKWKMAHMKKGEMMSKSAKGMGALVAAASKVAKWSLVEDPDKGEVSPKGGWMTPLDKMGKGKITDEEKDWEEGQMTGATTGTAEDEAIAKDKRLSEIDFRQGREAALAEMARRQAATPEPKSRRESHRSVRHVASTASLPAVPPPAAYALRRGSVPAHLSGPGTGTVPGHNPDFSYSSTSEVFLQGYNFPPRIDSSTANLLRRDSVPNSPTGSEGSPSFARPASFEIPPHAPFDYSGRRASLPTVIPLTLTREAMFSSSLARIQSLPEADQDNHSAHSPPLGGFASPSFSNKELHMEDGPDEHDAEDAAVSAAEDRADIQAKSDRAKRARRWEREGWSTAIQKFLGFDVVTKEEVFKIVLTGTIAGFGVAAMHYIGQLSIVGMPWIQYDPAFVVGSVIIAAGAVVIALYIMFIMLRPKLKHGFLYKICIAVILAVAVCCMHFCGMMGTTYAWPINTPITKHDLLGGTNGAIVGIVTALAFTACLACGVFFAFEAIQTRRERLRRRRVVVASIMFDDQDRILVNSTDGLPPMCDIASLSGAGDGSTKTSSKRSTKDSFTSTGASTILGMDLTPGHEAFVNALRLSWFWRNPQYSALNPFTRSPDTVATSITAAVPSVNLSIQEIRRGSMQTVNSSTIGGSVRASKISVNRFLERFVVSAGQLAVRLTGQEDGIQRLGVLYDQILTTGWVKLSNSHDTVSKGQLIILVRRVTAQQERADLLTRHYIFADASAVAASLQRTLSVPLEHMNPLLKDVRRFCDTTTRVDLQPGTLYAGVAIVQATPFDGLRILLEEKTRSQLPMRELCTFTSSTMSRLSHNTAATEELGGSVEDIGEALTWLEGMNLLSIIGRNVAVSHTSPKDAVGGPIVTQLLRHIERAIVPMLDGMLSQDDMAHVIPRLALHPVLVPLTPHRPRINPLISASNYIPPYMIVLYANYDAAVNTFTDKWLPFNLFRAQNSCVMAPYVGGEVAMSRGGANMAGDSVTVLPDGFNPGRRPSKVQFEFPPQTQSHPQHTPSSSSPLGNNSYSPTPSPMNLEISPDPTSSFAGFSFPARNPGSPPPPSSENFSDIAAPHSAPPAPINFPTHRLKDRGGPRRSSLAKPRDFAYPPSASAVSVANPLQGETFSAPASQSVYASDRYAGAQGVGEWDPDWLLVLLRSRLRADA